MSERTRSKHTPAKSSTGEGSFGGGRGKRSKGIQRFTSVRGKNNRETGADMGEREVPLVLRDSPAIFEETCGGPKW